MEDESYISDKLKDFKLGSRLDPETGCLIWQRTLGNNGYGYFQFRKKSWLAHRLAVLFSGREIPEGMQVDHLCRNRACVNPDHLDVVTPIENVRRGITGEVTRSRVLAKTHCPQGHPYEGDNLMIIELKNGTKQRSCRACRRVASSAYYARMSALAKAAVDPDAMPNILKRDRIRAAKWKDDNRDRYNAYMRDYQRKRRESISNA